MCLGLAASSRFKAPILTRKIEEICESAGMVLGQAEKPDRHACDEQNIGTNAPYVTPEAFEFYSSGDTILDVTAKIERPFILIGRS
jgi:hypothetical protein